MNRRGKAWRGLAKRCDARQGRQGGSRIGRV